MQPSLELARKPAATALDHLNDQQEIARAR